MKLIDYDELLHEALRQLIHRLLGRTQEKGLPGEHHFYISFKTAACQIAPWLKKRYPDEMTIVIQKQFEDLIVEEDKFSVTLYFDNRPERITVPLKALTGFADPHASFSLRMKASNFSEQELSNLAPTDGSLDEETDDEKDSLKDSKGQVVELDAFRNKK